MTADDDPRFDARLAFLIQQAVDALTPLERAWREAVCEQSGEIGPRLTINGDEITVSWGRVPLLRCDLDLFVTADGSDPYMDGIVFCRMPEIPDDPRDAT